MSSRAMSRVFTGDQRDVQYEYIRPFELLAWQHEPWVDYSPSLLLTGAAGGGKSRLAAEKIHGYCLRYPGATGLVLRKVRSSMKNSTILFLERKVIGKDPRVTHRPGDFRFEYDNGSILAYGGMKDDEQREHIRSIGQDGGVDIAWMEEATQFDEEDYNEVTARMRGKAASWNQIILTTNPDSPLHWINRRLIIGGEASVYYSGPRDNPNNSEGYLKSLSRLTGTQKERLLHGRWVIGSGVVYDTWSDEYNAKSGNSHGGNVTLEADYIAGGGNVAWTIDDGYAGSLDIGTGLYPANAHPRVFLMIQERGNGVFSVFGEHYMTQITATDHLGIVVDVCKDNEWPLPSRAVRDRAAANLGGAIRSVLGIEARYETMTKDESIKELRELLQADGNGHRRVIVHPRCKHLRYEMASYSLINGAPAKFNDHGPDALRYYAWHKSHGTSGTVDIVTYSGRRVVNR